MRKVSFFLVTTIIVIFPTIVLGQGNAGQGNTEQGVGATNQEEALTQEQVEEKKRIKQEEREARREEFRNRLTLIKNEQKRQIVEKIDAAFGNILSKRVTNWNHILDTFTSILDKIETRAQSLEGEGIDVSTVTTAITSARETITTAQTAVSSQAEMEYLPDIQDEETLKNVVSTTKDIMKTDLKTTQESVAAAKTAVREAAQALGAIKNALE